MASDKCLFWKLPVEIRFAIYDLAYTSGRTIVPGKYHVLMELVDVRGGRQKAAPIASEKKRIECDPGVVGTRIVSKQYLAETLQHLAQSNWFGFGPGRLGFTVLRADFLVHVRSICLYWYRNVTAETGYVLSRCPRLRRLRLTIDSEEIAEALEEDRPGVSVKKDLKRLDMVKAFSWARGVRDFTLQDMWRPSRDDLLTSPTYQDKVVKMRVMVKALEELLREMVTSPKETTKTPVEASSRAQRAARREARAS